MPAYLSASVTASSHGSASDGVYTAIFGAFSSGTASMLLAAISRANLAELRVVDRLDGDAGEAGLTAQLRRVGEQERAAAIVEQPLGRRARLDRGVRQPVRLEVVLLRVVHRHEQPLRGERRAWHERHEHQRGATEQSA